MHPFAVGSSTELGNSARAFLVMLAARRRRGATRSALPAAMPRLAGGMHVLGSFIGTDDFVRAAALAHVEGADASSIRSAVDAVSLLAVSEARNPRDISGTLLRVCVVSKLSYLCRTFRPDLFLPAARRADVLLEGAFSAIYSVSRNIFGVGATAEERLAAARVHLPTSLEGCGLRSAVTTSDVAYVAAWRAVAPAIAAASSDAARDALESLHLRPPAAPVLRALVDAIERVGPALPDEDSDAVAPDTFTAEVKKGIQRRITHALPGARREPMFRARQWSDLAAARRARRGSRAPSRALAEPPQIWHGDPA
jgi:hypothetical protein